MNQDLQFFCTFWKCISLASRALREKKKHGGKLEPKLISAVAASGVQQYVGRAPVVGINAAQEVKILKY